MRVELWVRDSLVRRTTGEPTHRFVTAWNDLESKTARLAAERAWRVCSLAPHLLETEEQDWRAGFDARAAGYGLSVGDIIMCGEVALKVDPDGFSSTSKP